MKRVVAGLSLAALSACDIGGGAAQLEVGQAYCMAFGDDPEQPDRSDCSKPHDIFVAQADGTLVGLPLTGIDIVERANTAGGQFAMGDYTVPMRRARGHIRLDVDDEMAPGTDLWLLPATTAAGWKMEQIVADLNDFEAATALPDGQPAFVDVPLCYEEERFTNGRLDQRFNHCNGKNFTFFTSLGSIVSIDFEPLPPHGASPDDELDSVWKVDHRNATWTLQGNVGFPSMYSDFSWSLSPKGYPQTARKRERQQRTGFQQPYNPNRFETALAYSFYEGADREEVIEYYRTNVYPALQRRKVFAPHFPELINR